MTDKQVKIDDITYEIKEDTSLPRTARRFYIRAGHPYGYVTDTVTRREVDSVAKSMRQLGFTVVDRT